MLKVIIADDEERICQLIQALIDWDSYSMEIAGIAHNGIEACELVEKMEPDILITDIRMPGCSGLELIERVKQRAENMEIIVISGYAHFEYAQQAIRFGVGDYLLKPINKAELTATLVKLKERISEKKEQEQDKRQQQRQAEQNARRLRETLVAVLENEEVSGPSIEELAGKYSLQVVPGLFQAICLKMDYDRNALSASSVAAVMEKVKEVLERGLKDRCADMVLKVENSVCTGFLNYEKKQQDGIRRTLKSCLNQMESQKVLFGTGVFSMSAGKACQDPAELGQSMKDALNLVQDRIVKGTGRLLERPGEPSALKDSNIMEKYIREITQAIELMSAERADGAVDILAQEIHGIKDVRGYEIFELVYSAADILAARLQIEDSARKREEFHQECDQCSSVDELLTCLKEFQKKYIADMTKRRENDAIRPIRNAKQYIQAHYSEPITQEEVSSEVGLSAAYFSVLFKKTEGEGFAKYLIKVRMEQAKVLLRETNISVGEICRKVGYNDLKHFTHTFEKFSGVKPAIYRKLYG